MESLKTTKEYKDLLKLFTEKSFPIILDNIRGFLLAVIVNDLSKYSKAPFLFIFPTEKAAESFYNDYKLCNDEILYFPSWETLPYSSETPSPYIYGLRINTLVRLLSSGKADGKTDANAGSKTANKKDGKIVVKAHQRNKKVVAMSQKTFLSYLPDKDFLSPFFINFKRGSKIASVDIGVKLEQAGYLRVPRATIPGEFALRGEVLDIFMPGMDEAVRIVFEFEKIESIKLFDPIDQHSTEETDEITLYPNREIIWTEELIKKAYDKKIITIEQMEHLFSFRTIPDEEYIFPHIFEKKSMITDYAGEDSTLILVDSEILESNSDIFMKETESLFRLRKSGAILAETPVIQAQSPVIPAKAGIRMSAKAELTGAKLIDPSVIFPDYKSVLETIKRKIILPVMGSSFVGEDRIKFGYEPGRSFFGNFTYLKEEIKKLLDAGYSVYIFSSSDYQRMRIENIFKDFDVNVIFASISSGFVFPKLKIIAINENEIFGRKKRIPLSVKKSKSKAIDSFIELNPGDYIVHVNYGIGKFLGIDRIKAAGTERDYIQLEYADEETIFIPIEQVNLVQRYIGSEGGTPHLDRLGGKSWEARKNKVKQAAEDIAQKLINIYSKRKSAKGFAFPKDNDWQVEFEAAFPFEETEDQLISVNEIKADMESPMPMDRLLCGDVGYGKTEVAMRASFKAASAGKQVAYLAPTTILVDQHFENFKERFKSYPINIAMLSRFVKKREQKKIIKNIKDGNIDIVIGTHRLLQKDVEFKNLGLMITDEEQRFGVKDKERMKEMKASIDCLALSATPIPRTLHMSLLKIRDMSVLKTPPHNRRPIETSVQEFNEETVVTAIQKEINRGGQVYYLHNKIETLDNVRLFLQKLMPEIIVETAHGKMDANEIEDVMRRFIQHGVHVLVSTTIIENGIDIPNVNTIIIDRADMYGISQLYQLRGRVGRSDRIAYAYLLYPERRALTELAMKRLQIISDNTELGSGFKIALKDLEVRGAGNLLGKQQSGEIASVGFDMYLRLIDEAVRELEKDKEQEEAPEVYLELTYSGFIPDTYIKDQLEKMEIYKSIAAVSSQEELDRLYGELEDRFGPIPDEVESLMSLAEIKIICKKLFISSLKERKGILEIEFAKVSIISPDKIILLIKEAKGSIKLDPYRANVLIIKTEIIGLKEKSAFLRERLMRLL
ncbi:MAG: transcription-repair coupling factor [Spirochaetaceae bacterium]|nr:transcription-repair coupling factor [Spirochaetaceae bacterium]